MAFGRLAGKAVPRPGMSKRLRLVVIGCVKFSQSMLEELVSLKSVEICGVVTKKRSDLNADFVDLATSPGIGRVPVYHSMSNDQEALASWLKARGPDVLFCLGWSSLLKQYVLSIPPLGVVGYHPALLPRNRGRHPIIWALALGLKETGSSFFLMNEGADSGPILSQSHVRILDEDDAASLYAKLELVARQQIRFVIEGLRSGTLDHVPQDPAKATYWRKRGSADGRIDWRMPAEGVHNLVRALSAPYPGAHVEYRGGDVKVWKTRLGRAGLMDVEPGHVLAVNADEIHVQCGMGTTLLLNCHEFKQPLSAGEYL
jgi:methionyl-tRNA formyltransferase